MGYWLLVVALVVAGPVVVVVAVSDRLAPLLSSRRALFLVSLILTGLVAGNFLAVQLGQLQVQEGLDAEQFTFFKQRFERAVGGVMPPLMVLTTLSPLPLLIALRRGPRVALVLTATALLLWIAATVVTLVYNVPVNAAAGGWDPHHPPADWEELRARWHLGQTLRTAMTLPAFACLVWAALLDDRGDGAGGR